MLLAPPLPPLSARHPQLPCCLLLTPLRGLLQLPWRSAALAPPLPLPSLLLPELCLLLLPLPLRPPPPRCPLLPLLLLYLTLPIPMRRATQHVATLRIFQPTMPLALQTGSLRV